MTGSIRQRTSNLCSTEILSFWKRCEEDYGGEVQGVGDVTNLDAIWSRILRTRVRVGEARIQVYSVSKRRGEWLATGTPSLV